MHLDPAVSGVAEHAAALHRLVARLDDTAAVLTGVRAAVVWDDAVGREWSDRLDLVHRAVRRLADDAATEAAERERAAEGQPSGAVPGHGEEQAAARHIGGAPGPWGTGGAAGEPGVPGVCLPGTAGIRATDRRGVVAPHLPPMEGTADR